MDWQPIETAPRNGETVLLGWLSGYVTAGYYDIHRTSNTYGWWTPRGLLFGSLAPTHWTPLPSPPT